MEVYACIVNSKLQFPDYCKDKEFKQLMVQMLCKNQAIRLTKINKIKNHFWFQDFNWDELMNMNMEAPYKPIKNKNTQETDENQGMKFSEYANKFYKEWEPSEGSESIPNDKKEEYEQWWKNF